MRLDAIARRIPFFSHNRRNLFAFRDADHLRAPPARSKDKRHRIARAQNGVTLPATGRIMLLTLPRVLGYVFNPVSFYFCFDAAGAPLLRRGRSRQHLSAK